MSEPVDQLTIETPELISLEYSLAGVGSRSMAILFDTLLQCVVLFVLTIAVECLSKALKSPAQAFNYNPNGWALAILIFLAYSVYWGYFAAFELFWNGQTPGKRYMKIRVLHKSGRPLTAVEAIERNFLRIVDSLPTLYLLGMLFAIFGARKQRLGDLAAGSVVVHEAPAANDDDWYAQTPHPEMALGEVRILSADEFRMAELFLLRRRDLPLGKREALARRIAALMALRLHLPEKAFDDELMLEELTRRWRDAASYGAS